MLGLPGLVKKVPRKRKCNGYKNFGITLFELHIWASLSRGKEGMRIMIGHFASSLRLWLYIHIFYLQSIKGIHETVGLTLEISR